MSGLLSKGLLSEKAVSGNPVYNPIAYLYNAGNSHVALTGGWSSSGYSFYSGYTVIAPVINPDHIALTTPNASYRVAMAGTANAIDLTPYTSIKALFEHVYVANHILYLHVSLGKTNTEANSIGKAQANPTKSGLIELTIDVTAINQSCYIDAAHSNGGFSTQGSTTKLLKVWLE